MKNMKKLLQKAMVFTLTAAMLVGTPLTASAAGLVDLYKTEDGWGNTVGSNGEDDTRTGTVTATQTNTTILSDAEESLLGISLDEVDLEIKSLSDTPTLTATLDWKEGKKDAEKEAVYLKQLKWSSSNRNIVALQAGEEFKGGPRNKITLVPHSAGVATITVSLNKDGKTIYSADATVTVENYASSLAFDKDKIKEDAFRGNTLVLDEYVIRNGNKEETTSDELTYAIKDSGKVTSYKNGVLTLKKAGQIEVKAIGKYVNSPWETIEILNGSNAKKLEFDGGNKQTWKINDKGTNGYEVTVKATQKDGTENCTNQVTWTSKKPAIVDIESSESRFKDDKCSAKLVAKATGKAQIVAKASNGKSATLTVTVSADLSKIDIVEVPTTLYSGQTIDLYAMADQYFGKDDKDLSNKNFTDAGLKWTLASGDKKVAKLSTKGVLSISADLSKATSDKITVKAENAKKTDKAAKGTITATTAEITLSQIDVTGIVVKDSKGNELIKAPVSNGKVGTYNKKVTETIVVDQEKTYTLMATANDKDGKAITDENVLKSVLGWSASGNGKTVKTWRTTAEGVIKGLKKGTSTVSVTGASKKGTGYKAVKVTFKEQVTAPSKTLTLSVKNKGIAATGKNQNITITPKFEKGSTTKNNGKGDVTWLAWKNNQRDDSLISNKGKLTLKAGSYNAGDTFKVRAIVKDGPIKTITLTVVDPSNKVEFRESDAATAKLKPLKMKITDPVKSVVTKVIFKDKSLHVPGYVSADGKEHIAPVTYTMNKAGIVHVVDKGNGVVTIEPLTKGSVTITATSSDGKKGTVKVTVTD